jgi:hypothetical protein
MWEVFNPKFGVPVVSVRFEWVACLFAHLLGLDYARRGEGYVSG